MSWTKLLALLFVSCGLARAQELFQEEDDFAKSDVDRIYVKALNHLARTQLQDGTWPDKPYGAEPAVVALSVISMLAPGDEPQFWIIQ